jgi:hypothetical protein
MFRRETAISVGGYRQGYAPAEDVDLSTRVADEHVALAIPEGLVEYRVHGNSAPVPAFKTNRSDKTRPAQRCKKTQWPSGNQL